jgi:hypothetical protein
METRSISGVRLYYDSHEGEAVEILSAACEKSILAINATWQLPVPGDCRVYLMDSWPRCVFLGAPLASQILLGLTLPIWYRDFKTRWEYAGGWSQRYGQRQVVGIKTPELIAEATDAMGESLFVQETDPGQKYLSIVCHELTHACSSHLALPSWLNEGLAMVSVDRCLEKQTVLDETLDLLESAQGNGQPAEKLDMAAQSRQQIILLYVRGYWLTRYLEETHSDLICELLSDQASSSDIEARIADSLNFARDQFWKDADALLVENYNRN